MAVSIYMCLACVNGVYYVLRRVAWTIDACVFNCEACMRVRRRSPWTEAELNSSMLPCHLICSPSDCFPRFLSVSLSGFSWPPLGHYHNSNCNDISLSSTGSGELSNTTSKHMVGPCDFSFEFLFSFFFEYQKVYILWKHMLIPNQAYM